MMMTSGRSPASFIINAVGVYYKPLIGAADSRPALDEAALRIIRIMLRNCLSKDARRRTGIPGENLILP